MKEKHPNTVGRRIRSDTVRSLAIFWLGGGLSVGLVVGCATPGPSRDDARAMLEAGRATEALAAFDRELPDDFESARLYVEIAAHAGALEEVMERLRAADAGAATDTSPSRPRASAGSAPERLPPVVRHYALGLALIASEAAVSDEASNHLSRAAALAPHAGEPSLRLGIGLLSAERYAEALHALSKAARREPTALTHLALARVHAALGQPEEATAALGALVAAEPTADHLEAARSVMDALARAASPLPPEAQPRIERALSWLEGAAVPQEAIQSLSDTLRDFPDLAIAHALLGLAYQRMDDAPRAIDALRRAIALAPYDARPHIYLALVYRSRARPARALESLETALRLDPLQDEAHALVADLALEEGRTDRAMTALTALTHLRPEDAEGPLRLGRLYLQEGELAASRRAVERARDREPASASVRLALAGIEIAALREATRDAERSRLRERAMEHLEAALELEPSNVMASRLLSQLKTGRLPEALPH